MDTTPINSADPKVHSQHIEEMLRNVIDHVRQDLDRVNEPRFQALLETTAEVLTGLHKPLLPITAKVMRRPGNARRRP